MDSLFSGVTAYEQVLFLLGAFFCAYIGGFLLFDALYWRRHAQRAAGIVAGVRLRHKHFYPVYRYQLPSGQTVETTSGIGVNMPRGMETGRAVALMYFPEDPEDVRLADGRGFFLTGLVMLAPGIALAWFALAHYPVTRATWFMLSCFAIYAVLWVQRYAKRRHTGTRSWMAEVRRQHAREMTALPVQRAEEFLPPAGGNDGGGDAPKS